MSGGFEIRIYTEPTETEFAGAQGRQLVPFASDEGMTLKANWLNTLARNWLPWRASGLAHGVASEQAAVYLSGATLATVKATIGEHITADVCAQPFRQLTDLHDVLVAQVARVGLGKSRAAQRVNLVLAPELYNLCMVERPDVADDELDEAVRWLIQEQIDYPVESATLSTFPLPHSASRDRDMVFVAAMPTEFLKSLLMQVQGCGIALQSIDISELALRNLIWRYFPMPDLSVALLRLSVNSGLINVSRGDELYLARRLTGVPISFSEASWNDFRERLLLQVQRSIDYYESAMNQPPCNMLMVACTEDWTQRVCGHLGEMLAVPVRSVSEILHSELAVNLCALDAPDEPIDWSNVSDAQTNALAAGLPALGGLLRAHIEASQDGEAAAA